MHQQITAVLRLSTQIQFFIYVKEQLDIARSNSARNNDDRETRRDRMLLPSTIATRDAVLIYLHWILFGKSERSYVYIIRAAMGKNTIHEIFTSIKYHSQNFNALFTHVKTFEERLEIANRHSKSKELDVVTLKLDGKHFKVIYQPYKARKKSEYYSYKKKKISYVNSVIVVLRNNWIAWVSDHLPAKNNDVVIMNTYAHDLRNVLINSTPSREYLDSILGDKGFVSNFLENQLEIMCPKKKPKKGELTLSEKRTNKLIEAERKDIEGIKMYNLIYRYIWNTY